MGSNKKTKAAENAKCIVLKKATFSWYFHVLISMMNFTTMTCCGLFLSTTKVDFDSMELVKHQHGYVAFLISFWITLSDLIYFNIYTVIDLTKDNKKKELLHTIASYLLFSVVFPLSLVVAILFWTFYHYDREIIYPKFMDDVFPPVLNHMTHTYPALFAVLFMVTSNKYVPPKNKSLAVLLAIICAYTACIVHIRLRDGKWVYILLDMISPLERACVFAFFVIGSIAFHSLGYFLNNRLTRIFCLPQKLCIEIS